MTFQSISCLKGWRRVYAKSWERFGGCLNQLMMMEVILYGFVPQLILLFPNYAGEGWSLWKMVRNHGFGFSMRDSLIFVIDVFIWTTITSNVNRGFEVGDHWQKDNNNLGHISKLHHISQVGIMFSWFRVFLTETLMQRKKKIRQQQLRNVHRRMEVWWLLHWLRACLVILF